MSERSTCRGCGATIIWATNPATGKKVPLDPKPPIYRCSEVNGVIEALREDDDELMVSHFATCSKANDFSGGGKRKAESSAVAS